MNTQLKSMRKKLGKTQEQVAKEVNISKAQYQNIEYEKSKPNVCTAILIAKSLCSTVEDLFS